MRNVNGSAGGPEARGRGLALDVLVILVVGTGLGLAFNQVAEGLPWIAEDRTQDVVRLGDAAGHDSYVTDETDPLGIGGGGAAAAGGAGLPDIPDAGRPIMIDLGPAKQFHDAGAALFVDAREPAEFAEGHIAGAINLPYDLAVSDPSRLTLPQAAGRPLIAYCGGGGCEMSLQLAHELMFIGQHAKVLVYEGGFPEWQAAGYPVGRGGAH